MPDIEEYLPSLKDGPLTVDAKHLVNFQTSSEGGKVYNQLSDNAVSPFVGRSKNATIPCFTLKGQPFKFIGINYYPLLLPGTTTAQVQAFMDAAKRRGINVIRTWCFDAPGNFRTLSYVVGTPNLITNPSFETDTSDWTVGDDFSRSSDYAHDGTESIKQVSSDGSYSQLIYTATVSENTDYVWTFWYMLSNTPGGQSQLPPRVVIGTTSGGTELANAGLLNNTSDDWSEWVQFQAKFNSGSNTTVYLTIQNWGGQSTAYYDDMNLSVQGASTLSYNESSFVRVDVALNEARKRGIKLILSLADGNENNYNTKGTYVTWANTIYNAGLSNAFPYLGFFTSSFCKQLYQDFIDKITSRKNTINGLVYKDDPAILSWELGNELRTNNFDPSFIVNTYNAPNLAILSKPGGWADIMSTYIKSKDPNHLVGFGDMRYVWQYFQNDTVANGTYYGVDYPTMIQLPNIDYLDFHIYPVQGDGVHLQEYGQHLGYADAVSGDGFRAQLAHYKSVAHAAGKPAICAETGMDSAPTPDTTYYSLYNRYTYFKNFFTDFLDTPIDGLEGGDGVIPWHGTTGATSSSYDIALTASGGESLTDNSNDTTLAQLIKTYNDRFGGDISISRNELNLQETPATYSYLVGASGTISIDAATGINVNSDIMISQTPTGTTTFNAVSVGNVGQKVIFVITTSGTSSYTLTFGTSFKSTGTLATGTSSGKVFTVTFISDGTNYNEISRTTAM